MCVCIWADWLRENIHYDGNRGTSCVCYMCIAVSPSIIYIHVRVCVHIYVVHVV